MSGQFRKQKSIPVPPCFVDEKHPGAGELDWREYANLIRGRVEPLKDGTPFYCVDCNPAFQRDMTISGRCSFPEMRFGFYRDHDGMESVHAIRPAVRKEKHRWPVDLTQYLRAGGTLSGLVLKREDDSHAH